MKNSSLLFSILFLLGFAIAEAQTPTDAGIPDAYHVLVVYNSLNQTSIDVKDYYQNARGIPESNIVPLPNLKDQDMTIDGSTHRVKIVQVTDIIQDSVNNANNADIPTKHAYKYFLDNIATPIKTHLVNNNLLSTIRYIVLIKGVPFKIQSGGDWCCGVKGNVTVDGLLCMLNTPDYDSFILDKVINKYGILNPYKDVDPYFTMEYRFLPDHFEGNEGQHLSYLVSHLDGISLDVVKSIIDKSIDPDMSGTAAWIIDDDPTKGPWYNFISAKDKLVDLGFTVFYDITNNWKTTYEGKVMGYASWGTHAEDGNCEWEDSAWVKDSLHFDLANGSVFNTHESFNGNSLTTLQWRYVSNDPSSNCNHTQGLATQFTEIGGTATIGHAWEPFGGVIDESIFFPAYQMGYNLVDAFYQSVTLLAAQYVIVGDPLVRIYNCENTVITTNTTISSGDYSCNVIVPLNVTLTIEADAVVNFKRNAKLLVYGTLEIADGASLNFNTYSRFYLEGNITMYGDSAFLNFNDNSVFKAKDISVDNALTTAFNDNSEFYLNENGTLITHPDNSFIFKDGSSFYVYGKLIVNAGNSLNFHNSSKIEVKNKIYFNAGAEVNFNNNSYLTIKGTMISSGEQGNNVVLNISGGLNRKLQIESADTILVNYTSFNNGGVKIALDQVVPVKIIQISNSLFESSNHSLLIAFKNTTLETPMHITNCCFNNISGTAIDISQVPELILEDNSINLLSNPLFTQSGINLFNNGIVNIIDCEITGGDYGIRSYTNNNAAEDTIEYRTDLESDISIRECLIQSQTGILFDVNTALSPISKLKIKDNQLNQCLTGIMINRFGSYIPEIKANYINGSTDGNSENGILLTNGSEINIYHNEIYNFLTGINLNIVTTPYILENNISTFSLSVEPLSGIHSVSSGGEIRMNTIQNHFYAIELGSSSPKIGANTITGNKSYGVYISANSNPDLSGSFVGDDQYPLSGYNTIRENGLCDIMKNSELYLFSSIVTLNKGCNTIADDREIDPINGCDYLYLVDGTKIPESIIKARSNYWGNHPRYGNDPTGRFGEEVTIDYSDYLREPCTYTEGSSELILANSKGEVFDTVYSTGNVANGLTDIESRYATANEYYYHNQYSQAKQEYQGIIQNYGNDKASIQAYNRLYTITNLTNDSPSIFSQLKDFYIQQASNQTDSVMFGTLTHFGDLCLVSAGEFLPAINNFDEIAQQNPNTDIALYRQIDALTTSLLVPQDSTMNKGLLGKYSVNSLSDYTHKLSELLRTRGKSGLGSSEELLPTEYTLYQNYPNPFNPTTTIKYDLPNAAEVTLIIYDILGRKVKELVNTKQQAGRYEVQFNSSNLASGVYIYQLIAAKFISSRKMILLK